MSIYTYSKIDNARAVTSFVENVSPEQIAELALQCENAIKNGHTFVMICSDEAARPVWEVAWNGVNYAPEGQWAKNYGSPMLDWSCIATWNGERESEIDAIVSAMEWEQCGDTWNRIKVNDYAFDIIYDCEDKVWTARGVDLKGCGTEADSYEELIEMIKDAMDLWLSVARDSGMVVPAPLAPWIRVS